MKNLTLKAAKQQLAAVGCTIAKCGYDYVVRVKGSPAGEGYHTDGLEDAVATGRAMANRDVEQQAKSHAPAVAPIPAVKAFIVASISSNTNSFGLSGIVLVARDGQAFEVGRSQHVDPWTRGQEVNIPCKYDARTGTFSGFSFPGCEIPRALPTCPPHVVAEVVKLVKS
jgi:hypothetical protein